ncbi:uncharacterized protein VTP21DRAFT_11615 [Calcarisporiella thermophila]|uniref:uncharacterized protein n=1 Tax=Calcarisporiella thermophila TaxID=911321 RepID=UPI0037429D4A
MTTSSLQFSRQRLLWLLFCCSLLSLFFQCASAQPVSIDRRQIPNIPEQLDPRVTLSRFQITVPAIVGAVILIAVGLYFALLGYRFFKVTMFFVGLYVVSILVATALLNTNAASNTALVLGVSLGVGVVAGLILVCCWFVGLFFLGGLGGFFLAMFILSLKTGGLIESNTGRIIFIICLVVAGGVLIWFLEKPITIIFTSLIGSFSLFLGIDFFAQTGLYACFDAFLHSGRFVADGKVYGMLAGMAVFFLIGLIVQFKFHSSLGGFRSRSSAPYGWNRNKAKQVGDV